MKHILIPVIALVLISATNVEAKKAVEPQLSVTTLTATSVGYTSARLNASVSKEADSWIEINTEGGIISLSHGNRQGFYSGIVVRLRCNTTYYYRAVASVGNGNAFYGNILHFRTAKCPVPSNKEPVVETI